MICCELDMSAIVPMSREQVIRLTQTTGRFESHIVFVHQNRTINGKSMLGLLALGDTGHEKIVLHVDGEDEEEAARTVQELILSGIRPEKNSHDAEMLLGVLKERMALALQDNLVGIYVHGSLAYGCFQWKSSNIDVVIVVHRPMKPKEKKEFLNVMLELEHDAPPHGFSCKVILEETARDLPYPIPCETRYISEFRKEYAADVEAFCQKSNEEDPLLTVGLMELRHSCLVVLGPQVLRVFGPTKQEDCMKSIVGYMDHITDKLREKPVYLILNLCRAVAYKKYGMIISKPEGGEWAMKHASLEYQAVIQAAINSYHDGFDMTYDYETARAFCSDAIAELKK